MAKADPDAVLLALLSLAVDMRDTLMPKGGRKTELILSESGMSNSEVALIMGKTEGAVAKAIQRARA